MAKIEAKRAAEGSNLVEVLEVLGKGMCLADVDKELAGVVKAVEESGKAGKLTLTLAIKPTDENMVEVTYEINAKRPLRKAPRSLFYSTHDGGLSRDNPRQGSLFPENN